MPRPVGRRSARVPRRLLHARRMPGLGPKSTRAPSHHPRTHTLHRRRRRRPAAPPAPPRPAPRGAANRQGGVAAAHRRRAAARDDVSGPRRGRRAAAGGGAGVSCGELQGACWSSNHAAAHCACVRMPCTHACSATSHGARRLGWRHGCRTELVRAATRTPLFVLHCARRSKHYVITVLEAQAAEGHLIHAWAKEAAQVQRRTQNSAPGALCLPCLCLYALRTGACVRACVCTGSRAVSCYLIRKRRTAGGGAGGLGPDDHAAAAGRATVSGPWCGVWSCTALYTSWCVCGASVCGGACVCTRKANAALKPSLCLRRRLCPRVQPTHQAPAAGGCG